MEFWYVSSRGLCKFCGKKTCPKTTGGKCSATKLQIHKFQNGELLNLVKKHATNADANVAGSDDQGAHGATRDPAKAAGKKTSAAESKVASAGKDTGKLNVNEKHALLDKMGERTKELKALMACSEENIRPHRGGPTPNEERATADFACAATRRLACAKISEEDLGDCDEIAFAGVVEQCSDNLSEGALGEAFTTQEKREPTTARYTNTMTGTTESGGREPNSARHRNTETGLIVNGGTRVSRHVPQHGTVTPGKEKPGGRREGG